jgi:hypothetical protein
MGSHKGSNSSGHLESNLSFQLQQPFKIVVSTIRKVRHEPTTKVPF